MDTVRPGHRESAAQHLAEMRERYRGHMLAPVGEPPAVPTIDDVKILAGIESLNFMDQAMSWAGVASELERTFVRCLRDPIQPRELQARLHRELRGVVGDRHRRRSHAPRSVLP